MCGIVRQRIKCIICGSYFLPRTRICKVCSPECRKKWSKQYQKQADRKKYEEKKRRIAGLMDKIYEDWLISPENHPRDPFAGAVLSWDGLHAVGYDEVPRELDFNLGF